MYSHSSSAGAGGDAPLDDGAARGGDGAQALAFASVTGSVSGSVTSVTGSVCVYFSFLFLSTASQASRIKIMSELDIAERRMPQDGRIKLVVGKEREVDFRVSVLPTLYGEKVVLRILDRSMLELDISKLGFEDDVLGYFDAGKCFSLKTLTVF